MNSVTDKPRSEDCARIKDLGYRSSRHIHMYGERFDIVSDPFPDGNGIAVVVTTAKEPTKRTLRLPTSILTGLSDLFPKVAESESGASSGLEVVTRLDFL